MNSHRNNTKAPSKSTDLDDWETDPDFIRDMDEMDQRWGSKRTIGSVNIQDLIEDAQKSHRLMREQMEHPSQKRRDDFRNITEQRRSDIPGYGYREETSKHSSSQEYSRKIITSSVKSGGVTEAKRILQEKCDDSFYKTKPSSSSTNVPTSSADHLDRQSSARGFKTTTSPVDNNQSEESYSKRFTREEKSSSSSKLPTDIAFKSIQKKIDAFKKEFEEMENKISGKYKETSSSSNNLDTRRREEEKSSYYDRSSSPNLSKQQPSTRLGSTSPLSGLRSDIPKSSIKSLSERFETMCREDDENLKRETDAKKKEFFSEIRNQVRETRKGLEGFDPIDADYYNEVDRRIREKLAKQPSISSNRLLNDNSTAHIGSSPSVSPALSATRTPTSPIAGTKSPISKPKFFTRREVTQEKVISRIVKENDKIIQNETKRNVERSSSCHGSSDEEGEQPTSIKLLNQEYRTSPLQGMSASPSDPIKYRNLPQREVDTRGAGLMARTLFDYQAAEDDELTFDVDDLITDIQKVDVNWYKGTITKEDGRKMTGLFPANYVKLLNDASEV